MSDRTTINVDKETHSEAGDVKDEFGETWPEVLQWYAEHRGQNGATDTEAMQVVPVEDVVGREVPSAQIDYVEIESRCKSAIEEVLSK